MNNFNQFVFSLLGCLSFFIGNAQFHGVNEILGSKEVYTTILPSLTLPNDARAAGMGDCGVATAADVNSLFYNPAKYAFAEKKNGIGLTHTPWKRQLVPDISLTSLSWYRKFDTSSALAFSFRYFDFGRTEFTSFLGGNQEPYEFSIDGAYTHKLNSKLSLGISLRYIYSNLVPNQPSIGIIIVGKGTSVTGDLSLYYQSQTQIRGHNSILAYGMNIQNIGTKINYTYPGQNYLLPAMLRMGAAMEIESTSNHAIMATIEITRLLVPVIPFNKNQIYGGWGDDDDTTIIYPKYNIDNRAGVFEGIAKSFHDSPDGFIGEIKEFNWSLGLEYSFMERYFLRTGYFHESFSKGNRRYFTFGTGMKFKNFEFNFAYLLPQVSDSPLKNTYKIGLNLEFESIAQKWKHFTTRFD